MIENIFLKNFKCFLSENIRCRPLTMLSGLNGMGKSTSLQALLLLRQSLEALLQKKGLLLNGGLINLGTNQDVLCDLAEEDFLDIGLTWQGHENKWRFSYNKEKDLLAFDIATGKDEVFETSLFTDHFFYLEAERSGPRTSFPMSYHHIEAQNLGSRGQYAAHYLARFGDDSIDEELQHKSSNSSKLRRQVESWLGEVSPGVQVSLVESNNMDLVNVEFAFPLSKQVISRKYRATNVGFGLSYTLPVLVALLASRKGDLILIENPEAHLHPRGQTRIGELIARVAASGRQVIFETHSDHVLNGIRVAVHQGCIPPEDVACHFFHREEGMTQLISPQIDRAGRLDKQPEFFFDEYAHNLDILLDPPGGV